MILFKSYGLSDAGRNRNRNEDCYLCNEEQRLFLVADGLGGHASGEAASKLAISSIEEFIIRSRSQKIEWLMEYRDDLSSEQNLLLNAVIFGDQTIRESADKNPAMKGMGTTLVGALLEEDHLAIVNIGDSRIYRIRDNSMVQLTIDHTLAEEQQRDGILTKNEIKNCPYRHVLTAAMGHIDNPSKIDISRAKIKEKDLYLICSDGLYNMLDNMEILTTINSINDGALSKMGLSLLCKANLAGGLDNITVVLLSFY